MIDFHWLISPGIVRLREWRRASQSSSDLNVPDSYGFPAKNLKKDNLYSQTTLGIEFQKFASKIWS